MLLAGCHLHLFVSGTSDYDSAAHIASKEPIKWFWLRAGGDGYDPSYVTLDEISDEEYEDMLESGNITVKSDELAVEERSAPRSSLASSVHRNLVYL